MSELRHPSRPYLRFRSALLHSVSMDMFAFAEWLNRNRDDLTAKILERDIPRDDQSAWMRLEFLGLNEDHL